MNTPRLPDYTTRKTYQREYDQKNREAINARKRAWRAARKNLSGGVESRHDTSPIRTGYEGQPITLEQPEESGSSAPPAQLST